MIYSHMTSNAINKSCHTSPPVATIGIALGDTVKAVG